MYPVPSLQPLEVEVGEGGGGHVLAGSQSWSLEKHSVFPHLDHFPSSLDQPACCLLGSARKSATCLFLLALGAQLLTQGTKPTISIGSCQPSRILFPVLGQGSYSSELSVPSLSLYSEWPHLVPRSAFLYPHLLWKASLSLHTLPLSLEYLRPISEGHPSWVASFMYTLAS